MVKKGAILFALMMMIGFGLIIYTPIAILSVNLSTYDTIDEFITYPYDSSNSSEIQNFNLNVDVGNIEVKYIAPPADYLVKVDVNIEMSGSNLAGKSYNDFFYITPELENINSTVNFTMEIISDDWFDPSLWSTQNVSVVVNIRKDVVLDIITVLDNGNFEIAVPYGVSIGNLRTNLSKGNIIYDFHHCTIEGNITGITNKGDLGLKSYNVEYTQNSNWMLNSTVGDMDVEISQYKEMGANITGTAMTTNGELGLFYKDNTANIGALFAFPLYPELYALPQEGFNIIFQGVGLSYISSDFPTINNYNLSFYYTISSIRDRNIELHSD